MNDNYEIHLPRDLKMKGIRKKKPKITRKITDIFPKKYTQKSQKGKRDGTHVSNECCEYVSIKSSFSISKEDEK